MARRKSSVKAPPPRVGDLVSFKDTDIWGKRTVSRTGRYKGRNWWGDRAVVDVPGFLGPLEAPLTGAGLKVVSRKNGKRKRVPSGRKPPKRR